MSTKNEELKAFLDGLKPGDTFKQVVRASWGPPRIENFTVAKRTATQIVMANGCRFRADDGRLIGNRNCGNLTLPPTQDREQEVRDENEQRELSATIRDCRWREVPLDKLRRIKAILEEKQDD